MRKFIFKTYEKETREYVYHVEAVDESIAKNKLLVERLEPGFYKEVKRIDKNKIVKMAFKVKVVSMKEERAKG